MPPSVLLSRHVGKVAQMLDALERDTTTSLAEKTRIFISAIPAIARALEADENREHIARIERKLGMNHHARAL